MSHLGSRSLFFTMSIITVLVYVSSGLGGAVGYALGGLDWTHTLLGKAFKSQEQILFVFAAVLFIISVALHLFSIKEEQYIPQQDRLEEEVDATSVKINSVLGLPASQKLEVIQENGQCEQSDLSAEPELNFLNVELVRSKSDSVLEMADSELQQLEYEALFLRQIEPSIFQERVSSYQGSEEFLYDRFSLKHLSLVEPEGEDVPLHSEPKPSNGQSAGHRATNRDSEQMLSNELKSSSANASIRRRRHTFYRQASSTFSYYGRLGSHRYRYRRANAAVLIKPSRSMNDIYEMQKLQRRDKRHRARHQSGNTTSSGDTESEEGDFETTVRLLWMSMLKMPKELWRLCLCHLLTWFSVIAEAVFYTDFMGQVIYEGDPTVR